MTDDTLHVWTTGASRAFQNNQPIASVPIMLTMAADVVGVLSESPELCRALGEQIAEGLHAHGDRIAERTADHTRNARIDAVEPTVFSPTDCRTASTAKNSEAP